MVVYTPADDATRRAVASLIAGQGADARFPCWAAHYPGQPDQPDAAAGSRGRPVRHQAPVLP